MPNILAIPAKSVEFLPLNQMVTNARDISKVLQTIVDEGKYMDRAALETDPTYRQPIPYVLIEWQHRDPGSDDSSLYVLMQRGKGQGESRLWGKHCIGAGGHIEEGHSLHYTALLEPVQELGLPIARLDPKGVFITDGSDVDKVHIAIFYRAVTHYRSFTSPEFGDQNPRWVSAQELGEHLDTMENWGKIVARDYLHLSTK